MDWEGKKKDYYRFIEGNYDANVYKQMLGSLQYLNLMGLRNDIGKEMFEEFKLKVHTLMNEDSRFYLLKKYFILSSIDDNYKCLEMLEKDDIVDLEDMKRLKYSLFSVPIATQLFPNKTFMNKNKILLLIRGVKKKEYIKFLKEFSEGSNNDVRTFLLKNKEITPLYLERICEEYDLIVYPRAGNLLSKIDAKELFHFVIENRININIPDAYIKDDNVFLIKKVKLGDNALEHVEVAKYILNLFQGNEDVKRDSVKELASKYNTWICINKVMWIYLRIYLNMNLELYEMEKMVNNEYKRLAKELDIMIEKRRETHKEKKDVKQEKIDNIVVMINEFINDNKNNEVTLKDFALKNNLSEEKCRALFKCIGKEHKSLYEEYSKIIKNSDDSMIKSAKQILNNMQNGIMENGIVRKYDIIDFCIESNISLSEMNNFISINQREFSVRERFVFNKFYIKFSSPIKTSINTIMNTNFNIGGKIVDGKLIGGYNLTNKDKSEIINFLNDNNVPLTIYAFNLAKNRYIKDNLSKKNSQ